MAILRLSSPRRGIVRLRAGLRGLRWSGRRLSVWPVILAWAIICGLLAFLPRWWLADWSDRAQKSWYLDAQIKASRLVQEWEHLTHQPPSFIRGDEAPIRRWLLQEPLVTSLVDPMGWHVWVRDGDRLRPGKDRSEKHTPSEWAARGVALSPGGGFVRGHSHHETIPKAADWWLVGGVNPRYRAECALVTFNGRWCLIKRWVPGSPEVERWLNGTLGIRATYRFAVFSGFKVEAASNQSPTLANPGYGPVLHRVPSAVIKDLGEAPYQVDMMLSAGFGDFWLVVLQMTPEVFKELRGAYLLRSRLAWLSYGLLVAISGLALSLILFSQSQERLQADRLASLAHSLKTPLAVLRLRCETALNPVLTLAAQESQLLEIRGETDQLVRTIVTGLESMRNCYASAGRDLVDGAFFELLDEKFSPHFEARGRALEVYGSDAPFGCCPPVLEAALGTLIENALEHGQGRVEVEANREPGLMRIIVRDQGAGFQQGELATGGNAAPGRGMGLLVLAQVARREGWGLAFALEDASFAGALEIPLQD